MPRSSFEPDTDIPRPNAVRDHKRRNRTRMIFRDKNLQLVRFVDETGDPARRLDSFEGRGHFEPG